MHFECSQQLMLYSSADPAPGTRGLTLRGVRPTRRCRHARHRGPGPTERSRGCPTAGMPSAPWQGCPQPPEDRAKGHVRGSAPALVPPAAAERNRGCSVTSRTTNRDNPAPTGWLWAPRGVYRLPRHRGPPSAAPALSRAPAIFSASTEPPLIVPLSFVKYPGQPSASHSLCGAAPPGRAPGLRLPPVGLPRWGEPGIWGGGTRHLGGSWTPSGD